jgi:hypothetical protein
LGDYRAGRASVNIRKIFKANCGPGARYIGSELKQRGEHNTVLVTFEMVPEGRKFNLDGVLHEGATRDEQIERAVVKIAGIARNIRATMAAPDGAGAVHVERLLS